MGYREIYQEWLENPYFDAQTKAELESISIQSWRSVRPACAE